MPASISSRDVVKSYSGKSKSKSSFSKVESKSKSSDSEIVKSKSIGRKSKFKSTGPSQVQVQVPKNWTPVGLESKSWFRVLHLCPTVQQKYDFMIATLVKLHRYNVRCAQLSR